MIIFNIIIADMKLGKEFPMHIEEVLPDWRDKFLCYKLLKKLLNNFPADIANHLYLSNDANAVAGVDDSESSVPSLGELRDW